MKVMVQSFRAALQLGISVLGLLVILGSLGWFAFAFSAMPPSNSGFAKGLAIILLVLYILIGFAVMAIGLWIPQRESEGIQFSARQRKLLMYGAVAPILTILLISFGARFTLPLTHSVLSIAVALLGGLVLSGPIVTVLVIVAKIME